MEDYHETVVLTVLYLEYDRLSEEHQEVST